MQEMQVPSLGQKIPWRREWQPSPVFLPGESHGQRSLASCSPWGRTVSDTSERLNSSKCPQQHAGVGPGVSAGRAHPRGLAERLQDHVLMAGAVLLWLCYCTRGAVFILYYGASHMPVTGRVTTLGRCVAHFLPCGRHSPFPTELRHGAGDEFQVRPTFSSL